MRSRRTGNAGAVEDLRRKTAGDLRDLRRNWGSAYQVTGAPVWRAVRRDNGATLIASCPGVLRDLISADYTACPVPRSCLSDWPRPLPVPQPHPLLTPAEVASVFQVDPRSVWRWEQAGDLECVHLPSGVRRYFRAQVDALVRDKPLTPDQVRALRDELAALAVGHPMGCTGTGS